MASNCTSHLNSKQAKLYHCDNHMHNALLIRLQARGKCRCCVAPFYTLISLVFKSYPVTCPDRTRSCRRASNVACSQYIQRRLEFELAELQSLDMYHHTADIIIKEDEGKRTPGYES